MHDQDLGVVLIAIGVVGISALVADLLTRNMQWRQRP